MVVFQIGIKDVEIIIKFKVDNVMPSARNKLQNQSMTHSFCCPLRSVNRYIIQAFRGLSSSNSYELRITSRSWELLCASASSTLKETLHADTYGYGN